jgi:cytochrome c-type biogenesis protein CcsB
MFKWLFSMKAAFVSMIFFAIAIGAATFIENDYGTQTARALVYNSRWFEIFLLYFTIVVIYNIFKFKMYRRDKWGQLVLHIAFVLIAVGAGLTRFIGYEGIMHIREGETSDIMVSDNMMLDIVLQNGDESRHYTKKLYLSSMTPNDIRGSFDIAGEKIDIELTDYLPSASEKIVPDPKNGTTILDMKISGKDSAGKRYLLSKGKDVDNGHFRILFSDKRGDDGKTIYIVDNEGNLSFTTPFPMDTMDMASGRRESLKPGTYRLDEKKLYGFSHGAFVVASIHPKSKIALKSLSLKPGGGNPEMLEMKIACANDEKSVRLEGMKAVVGTPVTTRCGDTTVRLSYGAKVIRLPFSLRLDDFELERYPGSMSPASYSSRVTLIDKERNITMPFHIYMNHVLDYRGYRFFQSSFDQDERGTVLSVNHDPGTIVTYIGYLLLAIGFIWSFITPSGRFQTLRKKLRKIHSSAGITTVAMFLALGLSSATPLHASTIPDSGLNAQEKKSIHSYDERHALDFGKLVVQGNGGRMKPLDTLAHEILSKIYGKSSLSGMNADQVLLGMLTHPEIYQKVKFIKISHPLIAKKLGLPKDSKYACYDDFFDNDGKEYKLFEDVKKANMKRAADRDKYDKELLKSDERVNVAYMTFNGSLLKIFPRPNDSKNRWYAPISAMKNFPDKGGEMVRLIVLSYFQSVNQGIKTGEWDKADNALDVIKKYQYFYGSSVIPSKERIEMEIAYNRFNIFSRLVPVYLLAGLLLLFMAFANIVKPSFSLKWPVRITLVILVAGFVAQTAGLILRWYIADHAPWSNAYESVIYISWATVLAGFVFSRKSPITLAATSILGGIFLFVAHLNWMDPQITNLVPVLKSYWLMIHVAVITASYGFLGLGALLGILTLILFVARGSKGDKNIDRAIKELTLINEMALLIGLGLLTVGNFLGGVWANESWGRYWGWDPKETWAAVTILVYAAVIHMRFIPKLNSIYAFNVAAVLAYSSVIMTYFGVNYYLSGMHSYAAGDPVPIPGWVMPAILSIFVLIAIASKNRKLK